MQQSWPGSNMHKNISLFVLNMKLKHFSVTTTRKNIKKKIIIIYTWIISSTHYAYIIDKEPWSKVSKAYNVNTSKFHNIMHLDWRYSKKLYISISENDRIHHTVCNILSSIVIQIILINTVTKIEKLRCEVLKQWLWRLCSQIFCSVFWQTGTNITGETCFQICGEAAEGWYLSTTLYSIIS